MGKSLLSARKKGNPEALRDCTGADNLWAVSQKEPVSLHIIDKAEVSDSNTYLRMPISYSTSNSK